LDPLRDLDRGEKGRPATNLYIEEKSRTWSRWGNLQQVLQLWNDDVLINGWCMDCTSQKERCRGVCEHTWADNGPTTTLETMVASRWPTTDSGAETQWVNTNFDWARVGSFMLG